MFSFFQKRRSALLADGLKKTTDAACEDVKAKWIYYDRTIHLKAGVPLEKKIDLFVQPIHEFFQNKYPVLLLGSPELFWLTVFTAILESGTHPKEEVNAAIAAIEGKYAGHALSRTT